MCGITPYTNSSNLFISHVITNSLKLNRRDSRTDCIYTISCLHFSFIFILSPPLKFNYQIMYFTVIYHFMFYLVTFTYQFNDSLNRIYLLLLKVFFCGATSQIGLGGRVFKVSGSHTIRHTHRVGRL